MVLYSYCMARGTDGQGDRVGSSRAWRAPSDEARRVRRGEAWRYGGLAGTLIQRVQVGLEPGSWSGRGDNLGYGHWLRDRTP
jgi:hypothetical protein